MLVVTNHLFMYLYFCYLLPCIQLAHLWILFWNGYMDDNIIITKHVDWLYLSYFWYCYVCMLNFATNYVSNMNYAISFTCKIYMLLWEAKWNSQLENLIWKFGVPISKVGIWVFYKVENLWHPKVKNYKRPTGLQNLD